jgi:hypothetical protein
MLISVNPLAHSPNDQMRDTTCMGPGLCQENGMDTNSDAALGLSQNLIEDLINMGADVHAGHKPVLGSRCLCQFF